MLHPQKHKNLTEVNGESSFFFALYAIKTKIAQDQSTTPEVLLDVPNINGYKKWWSYGHPQILRKKVVRSWGPVATSIRLVHTKCRSGQEKSRFFLSWKLLNMPNQPLFSCSEIPKNHVITHHIKWTKGHSQFYMAVNNHTKKTTYKVKSQPVNDMFSAPHISTGGSLNRLFGVGVIPEQASKIWLFFQKKVGRARVL